MDRDAEQERWEKRDRESFFEAYKGVHERMRANLPYHLKAGPWDPIHQWRLCVDGRPGIYIQGRNEGGARILIINAHPQSPGIREFLVETDSRDQRTRDAADALARAFKWTLYDDEPTTQGDDSP